jgi:hypothetical protein
VRIAAGDAVGERDQVFGYTIPSASKLGANIDVKLVFKFEAKMDLGRYRQKFASYFGENISAKFPPNRPLPLTN